MHVTLHFSTVCPAWSVPSCIVCPCVACFRVFCPSHAYCQGKPILKWICRWIPYMKTNNSQWSDNRPWNHSSSEQQSSYHDNHLLLSCSETQHPHTIHLPILSTMMQRFPFPDGSWTHQIVASLTTGSFSTHIFSTLSLAVAHVSSRHTTGLTALLFFIILVGTYVYDVQFYICGCS